jgi:hypothetical protein
VWTNWKRGDYGEEKLIGHRASVYALQLDSDNKVLVSASANGIIKGLSVSTLSSRSVSESSMPHHVRECSVGPANHEVHRHRGEAQSGHQQSLTGPGACVRGAFRVRGVLEHSHSSLPHSFGLYASRGAWPRHPRQMGASICGTSSTPRRELAPLTRRSAPIAVGIPSSHRCGRSTTRACTLSNSATNWIA